MYERVIPRDLFNESGLLKCMAKLCIGLDSRRFEDVGLVHDGGAFQIDQDPSSGGITILNVKLMARGEAAILYRPLNSRDSGRST